MGKTRTLKTNRGYQAPRSTCWLALEGLAFLSQTHRWKSYTSEFHFVDSPPKKEKNEKMRFLILAPAVTPNRSFHEFFKTVMVVMIMMIMIMIMVMMMMMMMTTNIIVMVMIVE